MALNIKNAEVEHLAAEIAERTGETKTQAIRVALEARKRSLEANPGKKPTKDLRAFLERHVWPFIPPGIRGTTITKQEEEEILGFGPDGY